MKTRVDGISDRLRFRGSKAERRRRQKDRRKERHRLAGLCLQCTEPAQPGHSLCRYHRVKAKAAREARATRLVDDQDRAIEREVLRSPQRVALLKKGIAAALYLRTSRLDQHPENQLPELRELAAARGLEVVEIFEDQISAVKHRPQFERMRHQAHMGGFNVLIVWALDRLGRSMFDMIRNIEELDRANCRILSVRETWLDTGGPIRQLLIAIFGWVAEQERARIIERTYAGLERARAEGRTLGRPKLAIDMQHVAKLAGDGLSVRQIASLLGCSRSSAGRARKRLSQNGAVNGAAK